MARAKRNMGDEQVVSQPCDISNIHVVAQIAIYIGFTETNAHWAATRIQELYQHGEVGDINDLVW